MDMSRDVVYKLAKNITSQDSLGKVAKYELDTCTGSRVIKNFLWGAFPPPRVEQG